MRTPGQRIRSALAAGAAVALCAGALTGCRSASLLSRPTTPMVLTGAALPSLLGTAADRVVAFRHTEELDGTGRAWTQIPVQVDQRKVVGFGSEPASNTAAGTAGTVYGSGPPGVTALQYADPGTFVGADADPTLDADDEVAFMVSDAGGKLAPEETSEPPGVVSRSGVAVRIDDPRRDGQVGWVYLFASDGTLSPAAGRDYVDYDFALTSGDYRTTYRRKSGPNPETSKVTTAAYEVGFSDRWMEVAWRVRAAGASGADILDGHKSQFAIDDCGRSNVTFAAGEGAFVANLDGPVRAIRSYVGANSGPLTQRTHLMYRDRIDVVTNLRVHAIPSILDFLDHSDAARGMTYRSSTQPAGVVIDGAPDVVSSTVPAWEAVDGPQGQAFTRSTFVADPFATPASQRWFHRDQTAPPERQCWGDGSFLGASGSSIDSRIENTDPRSTPFGTFVGTRTTQYAAPASDPSRVAEAAAAWADDLATPLSPTVSRYQP